MFRFALLACASLIATPFAQATDFTQAYQAADQSVVTCVLDRGPSRGPLATQPLQTRLGFAVASDVVLTMPIPISDAPVKLILPNGQETEGKIIVSDARTNFALIHISQAELTPLALATSPPPAGSSLVLATRDDLNTLILRPRMLAGKPAFAYPALGTTQTLTGESYRADWLGAPLVDASGAVQGVYGVGVPEQPVRYTRFWEASPGPEQVLLSNSVVQRLIDDWKENGLASEAPRRIQSGSIGIALAQHDGDVVIQRVMPDSAGEESGLEAGDKVIAFNKETIRSAKHLMCLVAEYRANDTVELTVERDGESVSAEIALQASPLNSTQVDNNALVPPGVAVPLGAPSSYQYRPGPDVHGPGPGVRGEALPHLPGVWNGSNQLFFTLKDGKLIPYGVENNESKSDDDRSEMPEPVLQLPGTSNTLDIRVPVLPSLQIQRSQAEESIRRLEDSLDSQSKQFEQLSRQMQELRRMLKQERNADSDRE